MADIQAGCCAFNFSGWPLAQSLGMVRRLGFRVADVGAGGVKPQINQLEAATEPERVGDWIAQLAAEEGLALSEMFITTIDVAGEAVRPSHPDAAARRVMLERLAGLCSCAVAAGCESVMALPGSPVEGIALEVTWATAVDTLRAMVEIAGERGVRLNVEPHSGSLIDKPALALRMAAEVPGLGYTLDYAHFIGQGIAQAEVDPLLAHATHLHAKQARPGSGKVPFHQGTWDVGALVAALRARGWQGVIAAECIGDLETLITEYNPAVQSALHGDALVRALEG